MWCVGDPQGTQLRACSTREEGQAATPLGGPQALTRPPLSVLPYAQSILATDSSLDCSVLSLKFLPEYHLLKKPPPTIQIKQHLPVTPCPKCTPNFSSWLLLLSDIVPWKYDMILNVLG